MYFEVKSNFIVHLEVDNTLLVRRSRANKKRLKICVSIASYETMIPLFKMFKSQPNRNTEGSVQDNTK